MTVPHDHRGGPAPTGPAGTPAAGSAGYRQAEFPAAGPAGYQQAGWPPGPPGSTPPGSAARPGPPAELPVPARPRVTLEPARLFGIAIAVLGALNFAFGFLPQITSSRIDQTLSVYAVGPGYVPILLLIAGLLALAAFVPGSERSRLAVAAVSVGGAVGALINLGSTGPVELLTSASVSKGLGAVLLTIFGIVQAVVAIAAFVVGADVRIGARTPGPPTDTPAAPVVGAGPPAGPWPTVSDPATGPIRPVGQPSAPGPPSWAPPGPSQQAPEPPVAYYAGWAPPPQDDRPTGPRRAVDPAGVEPDERQGPAERELPRVVSEPQAEPPVPEPAADRPPDRRPEDR